MVLNTFQMRHFLKKLNATLQPLRHTTDSHFLLIFTPNTYCFNDAQQLSTAFQECQAMNPNFHFMIVPNTSREWDVMDISGLPIPDKDAIMRKLDHIMSVETAQLPIPTTAPNTVLEQIFSQKKGVVQPPEGFNDGKK